MKIPKQDFFVLRFQDNVFLIIGIYQKTPLEDSVANTKSAWEPYYNVVSERPLEVAGVPAWEIIFTEKMGQSKIKTIDFNGEEHGYGITCFAPTPEKYDEFDSVFEEVINSFKLI